MHLNSHCSWDTARVLSARPAGAEPSWFQGQVPGARVPCWLQAQLSQHSRLRFRTSSGASAVPAQCQRGATWAGSGHARLVPPRHCPGTGTGPEPRPPEL